MRLFDVAVMVCNILLSLLREPLLINKQKSTNIYTVMTIKP